MPIAAVAQNTSASNRHRDPPRNPVLQGGEERRWPLRGHSGAIRGRGSPGLQAGEDVHPLADAVAFWATGLGDTHSHDAQIILLATAGNYDLVRVCLNIDTARYLDDVATRLAPEAAGLYILPNLALPHSEGEIVLHSADPGVHPSIRMH